MAGQGWGARGLGGVDCNPFGGREGQATAAAGWVAMAGQGMRFRGAHTGCMAAQPQFFQGNNGVLQPPHQKPTLPRDSLKAGFGGWAAGRRKSGATTEPVAADALLGDSVGDESLTSHPSPTVEVLAGLIASLPAAQRAELLRRLRVLP